MTFDPLKFQQIYQPFSDQSLGQLDHYYHSYIEFKDPIHKLTGLAALKAYFAHFTGSNQQSFFEFSDIFADRSHAYLHWHMHYAHPKLAQGHNLVLEGVSLIKYDSKIFYHQDFYDMNAMIYRHLPIVGSLTKFINHRIANPS